MGLVELVNSDLKVVINPWNARICSFTAKGTELMEGSVPDNLEDNDARVTKPKYSYFMFPFVGKSLDGLTPRHGLLRHVRWDTFGVYDVIAIFEQYYTAGTPIVCKTSKGDFVGRVPFSYRATVTYELKESFLRIQLDMEILSKKEQVACQIGYHPAFATRGLREVNVLSDGEVARTHKIEDINTALSSQAGALILDEVTSLEFGGIRMYHTMDATMLWKPAVDSPLLCVEPITNKKFLEPRQKRRWEVVIEPTIVA